MIAQDVPVDPRSDPLFLGREEEIRIAVAALRSGRHVLVTGEKGVGKSALMREVLAGLKRSQALTLSLPEQGPNSSDSSLRATMLWHGGIISVQQVSPLGECLKDIARQLWAARRLILPAEMREEEEWEKVKRWFAHLGAVGRQDCLCESLLAARAPFLISFDSLDRITATHQPFLERVLMSAVVFAAVVRPRDSYHFKKVWSSFTCIDLRPLPVEVAFEIAHRLVDSHNVRPTDRGLFEREVVKSSNGNPFHLRNLVWQSSREAYLGVDEIRSLRRIQEGDYLNMGPLYIFGASIFTLFKIFSLGTDNREFYIYFSALGFLVYLTFRVFRNFFLFRPQRPGR